MIDLITLKRSTLLRCLFTLKDECTIGIDIRNASTRDILLEILKVFDGTLNRESAFKIIKAFVLVDEKHHYLDECSNPHSEKVCVKCGEDDIIYQLRLILDGPGFYKHDCVKCNKDDIRSTLEKLTDNIEAFHKSISSIHDELRSIAPV